MGECSNIDKTSLSYWLPVIQAAGLPVPKTATIQIPKAAIDEACKVFDGKPIGDSIRSFAAEVAAIAEPFGDRYFLRTDHTSAKHDWQKTCDVSKGGDVVDHVLNIAFFSEFHMIPWQGGWSVREFLPTKPIDQCPNFGNMPVCKEFRFFVNGPEIECFHPYWPREALDQGRCEMSEALFNEMCRIDCEDDLRDIASRAGAALGGRWSVDLLETERGWYLTDMAEADRSFHWKGCRNEQR